MRFDPSPARGGVKAKVTAMSNRQPTPATEAARLCILRAGHAEMLCLSDIPEAKKTLEIARNHYRRAKTLGASPAVLDTAAAAGHKAAASIEAAEGAARRREEAEAERTKAERTKAERAEAEREASHALMFKKARLSRAYELKGMFTNECAKYVAESLISKGLASDLVSAVQAIIALLPCDPYDSKPEHIFEAWLTLDPIPTHPLAAPLATPFAA